MEQTKESFEAYLERCREENKWGDRPPVETIACPNCTGRVVAPGMKLVSEPWEWPVGVHVFAGTLWKYHCNYCGKSYSTPESDSVSLASLKLKANE